MANSEVAVRANGREREASEVGRGRGSERWRVNWCNVQRSDAVTRGKEWKVMLDVARCGRKRLPLRCVGFKLENSSSVRAEHVVSSNSCFLVNVMLFH